MNFLIAEDTSLTFLRTRWLFCGMILSALVMAGMTLLWMRRQAVQSGESFFRVLRRCWSQPFWLGGPFAARQREGMAQGCFTAAFVLFLVRWVLFVSTIETAFAHLIGKLMLDAVFWLITCKLFFLTRYSLRELCIAAAIAFPLVVASMINVSQLLLIQVLFLFCIKDIDLRKAFRIALCAVTAAVALIMLLAIAELIPSVRWMRGDHPRNSFGFGHVNSCGECLFYLAAGWFAVRFAQLRWRDWLFLAALLYLCSELVDSRAPSLGILLLIAAGVLTRCFPRLWELGWLRALGTAVPVLLAGGSFWAAFAYRADDPLWAALNRFSSDRFNLFHLAVTRLSATVFGQQPVYDSEFYTLDNAYLGNFYWMGVVGSLVYLALFCFAIYLCWKRGWVAETILLLSFSVYMCLEGACWPSATPAVLMLANAIYWPSQQLRISQPGLPGRPSAGAPAAGQGG